MKITKNQDNVLFVELESLLLDIEQIEHSITIFDVNNESEIMQKRAETWNVLKELLIKAYAPEQEEQKQEVVKK